MIPISTVGSQIQRAVTEAISDQILRQLQAILKSGQGHMPERRREEGKLEDWTLRSEEALYLHF